MSEGIGKGLAVLGAGIVSAVTIWVVGFDIWIAFFILALFFLAPRMVTETRRGALLESPRLRADLLNKLNNIVEALSRIENLLKESNELLEKIHKELQA